MPTIAEVRAQYPQYSDMSDQQLSDALHSKFYSDIPKQDFESRIGIAAPRPGFVKDQSQPKGGVLDTLDLPNQAPTPNEGKRFGDSLKSVFGGHNPIAETYDLVTNGLDPRSSRGVMERVGDTAAFVSSLPSQILKVPTPGQAVEAVTGSPAVVNAERRFVENNSPLLTLMDAAGSAAMAAPMGQAFQPGPVMRPGNAAPMGTRTGRTMAERRATEATADVAAHDALGVRPFGPSFNQGPVASVGKQLTETPLVGAPLRNNLDQTIQDAATATNRVADSISPQASLEQAGVAVQRGLDRYRDVGFESLDPGTVRALGIDPNSPVQRQQGGGQAQMARIQQAQPVVNQLTNGQVQNSRGQSVPLPQTRVQKLTTRTTLEDVSDAELSTVIRAPSEQTSFNTRMEALYERAQRSVPRLFRSNGSADAVMLPTSNAGEVVRRIAGDETRTGVTAGLQGRYGQMFQRLANPRSNATLDDLRAMRTAIGRDLSNFGLYEASLDRTQLRQIYAALSSDIEVGVQDIAARAAMRSQLPANDPRHVAPQAARRAQQALRDLQVANRFARAGFERMDRFLSVVKTDNPQQAARMLVKAATDRQGGNMNMFRTAMLALRPEERMQFGALITRELGVPQKSATGIVQEVGWSPSTFVTNYQALSPEARSMIYTPEHHAALQNLFRVANRLANVQALTNTSRSGTNTLNLGGAAAAAGSVLTGDPTSAILIGGSGLATSVMMSSPRYTRWMARYIQLRAEATAGTSNAINQLRSHVSSLANMASKNSTLAPVLSAVSQEMDGLDGGGAVGVRSNADRPNNQRQRPAPR